MKQWNDKDLRYLEEAYQAGSPCGKIAFALNKSSAAVRAKASRMGFCRPYTPWPEGALDLAIQLIDQDKSRKAIRIELETRFDISSKVSKSILNRAYKKYFTK